MERKESKSLYVCKICGYSTKYLSNFNRHKSRKTKCKKLIGGVENNPCTGDRTFIPMDLDNLNAHIQKTHKTLEINRVEKKSSYKNTDFINDFENKTMNKIKPEVHINNSIFQKINLDIPQIIKKRERIYQQNKQVVYKQNLMLYDDPNEAWETIKKFIKFINIKQNYLDKIKNITTSLKRSQPKTQEEKEEEKEKEKKENIFNNNTSITSITYEHMLSFFKKLINSNNDNHKKILNAFVWYLDSFDSIKERSFMYYEQPHLSYQLYLPVIRYSDSNYEVYLLDSNSEIFNLKIQPMIVCELKDIPPRPPKIVSVNCKFECKKGEKRYKCTKTMNKCEIKIEK